jgi:hypothetical protein
MEEIKVIGQGASSITFSIGDRTVRQRALILFDDKWNYCRIAAKVSDSYQNPEAYRNWFKRSGIQERSLNHFAIAFLPLYCATTANIGLVHLSDIPHGVKQSEGKDNKIGGQSAVLDLDGNTEERLETLPLYNTYFLFDIHVDGEDFTKTKPLVEGLIDECRRRGGLLQNFRCFTVGGEKLDVPIPTIYKEMISSGEGELLIEWIDGEQSKQIDWRLFDPTFGKPHHNPSGAVGNWGETAKVFIQTLAGKDTYGVWRWVLSVFEEETAKRKPDDKLLRYTYLCGKNFLRYGKAKVISYCALRGFLHGVTHDMTAERRKVLLEERNEIGIPHFQERNADELDTEQDGYVKLPESLEEFAHALRDWLSLIRTEHKMPVEQRAALEGFKLYRTSSSVTVTVVFSKPIGEKMVFAQKGDNGHGRDALKKVESMVCEKKLKWSNDRKEATAQIEYRQEREQAFGAT